MTEELDTLRRVFGNLEESGFNYMLTGSMAMEQIKNLNLDDMYNKISRADE